MDSFTRMGDVIRKIAQDHGENSLCNTQFFTAVFMDYAPKMQKEKELLRAFLLCNGAERLLREKNAAKQDQNACMESLVQNMVNNYCVAEASARHICSEFYWAVTNREWTFVNKKPNVPGKDRLDVRQDVYITQKEKNSGKNVTVSVGGKAVNVTIPSSVKDGETICFHQQGMLDTQTERHGDLYLTIHITAAPAKKPWWIIAAAAAVVVVILFLLVGGGKSKPSHSGQTSVQHNNSGQVVQKPEENHEHSWQEADCNAPKTCILCGETSGSKLEHQWSEATYQLPKTCTVCGITEGDPLGQAISTDTGIIAASPGGWATYALTDEGRVYAIGRNHHGQTDVSHISDAVAISGGDCHVAILHSDGTVSAIGRNKYGQCDTYGWNNMVGVAAGVYCTVGICEDGTVKLAGTSPKTTFRVSDWENIVQVDVGDHHILGLRSDGTVEVTGNTNMAACDVSDWTDIVYIATGEDHSVGVRSDGTVVAVGNRSTGACDVSGWTDIVAVTAGSGVTIGLRKDGTVVVAGDFPDKDKMTSMKGTVHTAESWEDVIQIGCTYYQIVGLTKDGYIYACGWNAYGQCDAEELHRQIN